MSDFLARVDGGELIALVAVGGGMLIAIVCVLAGVWHKIRTEEITANLKREMLDRGMSVDEIKAVLEAGSKGKPPLASVSWTSRT
jgi:hypothetical protein